MKRHIKFTKLGIYLVLVLLVLACSTSSEDTVPTGQDDEQNNDTETFNFTLNVNRGFSELTTATIYLSDANGIILDQTPIIENTQIVFTADGEENAKYDITMVYKTVFESGNIAYGTDILLNMEEGIYNYEYGEFNPLFGDQILLSIYNIGERPVRITNLGLNLLSFYSPSNGGTVDFSFFTSYHEELGGQYLSIHKRNDDFERYYWSQSPPVTDPVELDYFDLPVLENMITLEAPSGIHVAQLEIFGFRPSNTLNTGNRITTQYDITTENFGVYGVPEDLFNRYHMKLLYAKNNLSYLINRSQSSPFTTYPQSDLDLSVITNSINNFSASSSGDYDVFELNYTLEDGVTNYNFRIKGAKSDNFSFSKETLITNIFENQLNVNDLEYQWTRLKDYNYINNYQSYLQSYFEASGVPTKSLEYESVWSY